MDVQTTPTLNNNMDSLTENEPKRSQYDAVKMRYFLSLGMNKPGPSPQMASSVPSNFNSYMPPVNEPKKPAARARTKTSPGLLSMTSSFDEDELSQRKRATSTPIPIGQAIPIPIGGGSKIRSLVNSDDEEELDPGSFQDDGEEYPLSTPVLPSSVPMFDDESPDGETFVPPHEMLKKNASGFNVGTAQSVAVWEQRRRKYI